ncbi:hypothetical protein LMG6871_01866 [Ralstonia edaphis]|uniref:hypothetical protein n=1 Tax=Ralstonia edaphi TaxID=3058599 RepID=UPI0028F5196E|nr:hypothetical protein [Ralstonia sp. LMG 6871]CAJ0716653.1 hypothetical protein LMG6871_01866 [Ralstonia sp. LMG 6871]
MPLETVRFDRVFGITKTSQDRMPVTLFGFQSGAHIEYSVAAPGEPRIEAGMTVTAYLREPGNWQTLVAWRDHASGEIVCEAEAGWVLCLFGFVALCFLVPRLWNQPVTLMLAASVPIALFGSGVHNIRFLRSVRRQLAANADTRPLR